MSAWTNLLAASSRLTGTAWELLTSPKLGGGPVFYHGANVAVAAPQYAVVVDTPNYAASVDAKALGVAVANPSTHAAVDGTSVSVSVGASSFSVRVTP